MKRYVTLFVCAILLIQSGVNMAAAAPSAAAVPQTVQQSQPSSNQQGPDVWYVFNLEEPPLTRGINQAYAKYGNSADKPGKESTGGSHKELQQNGKTVGHISQGKTVLKYDNPGQQKKTAWDPIKVNLKNNPAPMLADVQPVGADGIQIISSKDPANAASDSLQLCQDYYAKLDIEWDNAFYEASSGECNLDPAIEKYVNRESNKQYGKNFFFTGDAEDPKNDWSKPTTQTAREFTFTFPDGLSPKSITLEVSGEKGKNHCKVDIAALPQGELKSSCPKEPDANFSISCAGNTCTFSAANENASSYYWELKNNPANRKAYKYGQEPRTMTVDETMQIQCQPGWIYEEDPNSPLNARRIRCVNPASNINMQSEIASVEEPASEEDDNYYALMGFTLAPVYEPPAQTITVDADLWIVDFSFDASFWFRASMDVGLRLPVQVNFTEPENWNEDVWAGDERSFETSITPKDFSVAEFKKICADNQLANGSSIHDCNAFTFPDFLNPADGDEFAARYDISAGVDVTPAEGDPWSLSVHQGLDLGQICTISNLLDAVGLDGEEIDQDKVQEIMENLATLGVDFVANGNQDLYEFLKDQSILCGSFTTPYGYEDGELRTFPFIPEAGYDIPANCLNAETISISGADRPICTNLYAGVPLASLGIGLNLKVQAGADVISADWSAAGDAKPAPGANTDRVRWIWDDENLYEDHSMPQTIGPIIFDNYDLERSLDHDVGSLVLDNFNYNLNFWLTISAGLEFGGIFSPLSVLLENTELELYSVSFSDITGIDGIPIPQHADMDPLKFSTNVKNYGLDVNITPDEALFPADLHPAFTTQVTNIGSLSDSFKNFRVELGNVPTDSPLYNSSQYTMNQNNDYDCLGAGGMHLGGPGKEIECYQSNGTAQPGVTLRINEDGNDGIDNDNDGLMDEDPDYDQWSAAFLQNPALINNLAAYQQDTSIRFTVTPLFHSMTRPGLYPVKLLADSMGSKVMSLPDLFPLPISSYGRDVLGYNEDNHVFGRINAFDVARLKVEAFANPQANVLPGQALVLPGNSTTYKGIALNGGNATDTVVITIARPDLNQSGCTIATLGPNCPYRALFTRLPDQWITDHFSASYGPLSPAGYGTGSYIINIPADWAGMQDTPYQWIVTASSTSQPGVSNTVVVVHTVKATFESQTRFIIKELNDLIAELNKANARGIKTCNLNSIASNSVKKQSERALQLVLAGRSRQALTALSTDLTLMQGSFMNGLRSCKSIPNSPWRVDWQIRAQALINDLRLVINQK